MTHWVTRQKLMDELGYTVGQVRSRVQRGRWRAGVEYADVDGARLFDLEAIDARADEMALTQRQPEHRQRRRPRLVSGGAPLARLK